MAHEAAVHDKWIALLSDTTRDRVTSEQRGSATLERYLDPSDDTLPDHAANAAAASLDSRYRFRVLAKKIFDN